MLDKSPGYDGLYSRPFGARQTAGRFSRVGKRGFAHKGLRRGERVKVKPNDFVYEYDGVWEEYPGFFRLKVMGEETRRSFPIGEVLRIEPTDRLRPKGKGNLVSR